jgi:hypothetical protein
MPVVVNYPPPSSVVVNEVTGAVTVVQSGKPGPQGIQGVPGVVTATSPATYDAPTQTVGVDQTAITLAQSQVTGLVASLDDPLGIGFVSTLADLKGQAGTVVAQANQTYYYKVVSGGVVGKVGLNVGVQSGDISVAVYANTGAGRTSAPGTQLATSGAVSCPAAGYAEVALDTTVTVARGDWLAISADNATVTFTGTTIAASAIRDGQAWRTPAHPAPSPAGTLSTSARHYALIGVP